MRASPGTVHPIGAGQAPSKTATTLLAPPVTVFAASARGLPAHGTGRQVHGGDVLVMLANGRITANAADFAKSQRLHLVDRHLLAEWASESRPPCGNSCVHSLQAAAGPAREHGPQLGRRPGGPSIRRVPEPVLCLRCDWRQATRLLAVEPPLEQLVARR